MSGVSTGATLKEEGQWGGACPLERGTAGTSGVGDRNVLSLDLTGYMGVPACKDSSSYTLISALSCKYIIPPNFLN